MKKRLIFILVCILTCLFLSNCGKKEIKQTNMVVENQTTTVPTMKPTAVPTSVPTSVPTPTPEPPNHVIPLGIGLEVYQMYPEQGTLMLYYGGKGVGNKYLIVDHKGNTVLEGTEGCIWKTTNGYARVVYCDPGTTNEMKNMSTAVLDGAPADIYANLYDWSGKQVESKLLGSNLNYSTAISQTRALYPVVDGERIDFFNTVYQGDFSGSDDTLDFETVSDGFIVRDKSGKELGYIKISGNPADYQPYVKGNLLILWPKGYSYCEQSYWVEFE